MYSVIKFSAEYQFHSSSKAKKNLKAWTLNHCSQYTIEIVEKEKNWRVEKNKQVEKK